MKDYIITAVILVIFITITLHLHLFYPICAVYFLLDVFAKVNERQLEKKHRAERMLKTLRENQELAEKFKELYRNEVLEDSKA